MRSLALLIVLMGTGLAVGCTAQKDLIATEGSRADGTVTLSYERYDFEKPKISLEQGTATARERCQAWGYSDARAFGGEKSECISQSGCGVSRVSMTFQCIGKPS